MSDNLSPEQFHQIRHDPGGSYLHVPLVGAFLQAGAEAAWNKISHTLQGDWDGTIVGGKK